MPERILMTGNDACGEGAIIAGCRFYAGYPITPQNELTEYMARRMAQVGGTFIQAESELAAISMVHGASAAGARAMTSSSSPGVSLKQEGISYLAGSRLPSVIVNVQRGGPGLGNIQPSQADYFQSTKGGGHGDYRLIVLAPHTVQETAALVRDAFDLADLYRVPALVFMDGLLGQMMEPAELPGPSNRALPEKDWALTGAADGRPQRIVKSFFWGQTELEEHNQRLQATYRRIQADEVRYETVGVDEADVVLVACGTTARVCKQVVAEWDASDVRIGLFRPITLWPFPTQPIRELADQGKRFLTVEMSAGQMVEDVRLAVEGRTPVDFHGRMGGGVPEARKIADRVRQVLSAAHWRPEQSHAGHR